MAYDEIELISGTCFTESVAKDQAVIDNAESLNSVMVGIADEAIAYSNGPSRTCKLANAHAVLYRCCGLQFKAIISRDADEIDAKRGWWRLAIREKAHAVFVRFCAVN